MAKKKTYTPAPSVPREQMERLARVVEVLAGMKTVSQAARDLDLSRNHFQSLLHRSVTGLLEGISPKPGGRPPKPARVAELEAENARLRKENAGLSERVGMTDRLLNVASGLLHGRIQTTGRGRRKKAAKTTETVGDEKGDDDPARRRARLLDAVLEMERCGLTRNLSAAIAGVHASTVRRWKARSRRGAPLVVGLGATRGVPRISPETARKVSEVVRSLNGLVGAEALRHTVPGVSRREAARIKAETRTEMERERKAALTRVSVTIPGVLRGMDAMQFSTPEGRQYALISADGAIPHRTSFVVGPRYDAVLVERALEEDLAKNGAPLVYRLDRASSHCAPGPRAILGANEVLVLHGPPRCARFYGQLERQNLEHRQWCAACGVIHAESLPGYLATMLKGVTELWRRRTLGFRTTAEVWNERPHLDVDRAALREDVADYAARIRQHLELRGKPADMAERLAIQRALETRGLLRLEVGGWC